MQFKKHSILVLPRKSGIQQHMAKLKMFSRPNPGAELFIFLKLWISYIIWCPVQSLSKISNHRIYKSKTMKCRPILIALFQSSIFHRLQEVAHVWTVYDFSGCSAWRVSCWKQAVYMWVGERLEELYATCFAFCALPELSSSILIAMQLRIYTIGLQQYACVLSLNYLKK